MPRATMSVWRLLRSTSLGTPLGAVCACRPLRPAQVAFHQYDINAPGFIA